MNDAGRIGFVPRGQYSNEEAYDFLDFVTYGNASYVARKLTVGNEPQEGSEYWQLIARTPDGAVTGVKGSAEAEYRTGDVSLGAENVGALPVRVVSMEELENEAFLNTLTAAGVYVLVHGIVLVVKGKWKLYNDSEDETTQIMQIVALAANRGSMQYRLYDDVRQEWTDFSYFEDGYYGKIDNLENDLYNLQRIYGSTAVSLGRTPGTAVGENSFAFGSGVEASGNYSFALGCDSDGPVVASGLGAAATGHSTTSSGTGSFAEGMYTKATSSAAHAEGFNTTASGQYSHAEGGWTIASGTSSHAGGENTEAAGGSSFAIGYGTYSGNFASCAVGKFNSGMAGGGASNTNIGDAFVVGNGVGSSGAGRSNALRVTYAGNVMGTRAFQSSGADYAEYFEKATGIGEDWTGYFVTVKDGYICKADSGDYIVGVVSGNPSVIGNADEDYYWRYERDVFGRIVLEDVPELVQKKDADGNPMFDKGTHEPVMEETGSTIKDARMKLADGYDPSLQDSYVPRVDRPEWECVGMLGVIPVRDDGTCIPGQFCKCADGGIATISSGMGGGYMVLKRVSGNVVSVIMR